LSAVRTIFPRGASTTTDLMQTMMCNGGAHATLNAKGFGIRGVKGFWACLPLDPERPLLFIHHAFGNDHAMDFRGAFINAGHPCIPIVAFHRVGLAVSVAAMDLDGQIGDPVAASEANSLAMADSLEKGRIAALSGPRPDRPSAGRHPPGWPCRRSWSGWPDAARWGPRTAAAAGHSVPPLPTPPGRSPPPGRRYPCGRYPARPGRFSAPCLPGPAGFFRAPGSRKADGTDRVGPHAAQVFQVPTTKPAAPRSATTTLIPRRPAAGSVRQKIRQTSATPPLVTKTLLALTTVMSPSARAVASMPPASEPALGSVRQKAPIFSPRARGGTQRSICAWLPKAMMG
jgi:hypothetical protein